MDPFKTTFKKLGIALILFSLLLVGLTYTLAPQNSIEYVIGMLGIGFGAFFLSLGFKKT